MKYRVLHFGEEPLRKDSEPVEVVDDEIKKLVNDLLETMHEANGVGLAAPQVGINRRVAVIDIGDGPLVLINPVILKKSGKEIANEGCLSFPGLSEKVERAVKVVAEATDEEGNVYEVEAEGLMARAIQHELDHLDGVLFVDRISKARKLQLKRELDLIKQGYDLSEEE